MLPWITELNELNPFTAYLFDATVTTFGIVIKNALQETRETGSGNNKKWVSKYNLAELLDDRFQFQPENGLSVFQGMDGYSEVSD